MLHGRPRVNLQMVRVVGSPRMEGVARKAGVREESRHSSDAELTTCSPYRVQNVGYPATRLACGGVTQLGRQDRGCAPEEQPTGTDGDGLPNTTLAATTYPSVVTPSRPILHPIERPSFWRLSRII